MSAVVKTLIPVRPVDQDFFLSTNIPFLDRNNSDAFSTRFQEEFRPFISKKAEPFSPPKPAQVIHRDLERIKEYRTHAKESYHPHKLPQINRTQSWTRLQTNFKMQTDPKEVAFLTTQSQKFCPQPFQPPTPPIRQIETPKVIQHAEKLPESTNKASYMPHNCYPDIKASTKHLAEGFPTIKGDRRRHSFVSQYNVTFLGAWSRAAVPMDKHPSVVMGDPVNIVERETTHAASFSRPTVCSPPVVTERLKLNLGNLSPILWSSTSREAFNHHKIGDPVVIRTNKNSSSILKGDTDTSRNKERMSLTTNRTSFSDQSLTVHPVNFPATDLMTKSQVKFSPLHMSSMYYLTTAREHFSKQDGERASPAIPLPSNILSGAEHDLKPSTTKSDYLPLKASRQTPCASQLRSNIRFPLAHQYFSTAHNEQCTAKPLVLQHPGVSLFSTNFVIQ